MIVLGALVDLLERDHGLAAYRPTCDRWAELDFATMIGAGHGGRRLPITVPCSACGLPGRLQA